MNKISEILESIYGNNKILIYKYNKSLDIHYTDTFLKLNVQGVYSNIAYTSLRELFLDELAELDMLYHNKRILLKKDTSLYILVNDFENLSWHTIATRLKKCVKAHSCCLWIDYTQDIMEISYPEKCIEAYRLDSLIWFNNTETMSVIYES